MKTKEKNKKDSNIDIERIIPPEHIREIRMKIESRPRDLLLFDLATKTGIQMQYLLRLRVKDLDGLKIGDRLPIAALAGKTPNVIVMTDTLYRTWRKYRDELKPNKEDYLIKSRKGSDPLRLSTVSEMIRRWLESAGVHGLGGAKALQRTWKHFQETNTHTSTKLPSKNSVEQILKPVRVNTVQEDVYQQLFSAIISGRIPPGERLVSHKLAKQMNVSQAPVREALRLLQAAGLVSSPQKKGSLVYELSKENLKEISGLRIMLEVRAGELAALNCDMENLRALETLHQKFILAIKENKIEETIEYNKQFHHTIYAAANMPILLNVIKGLWDRMSPYVHFLLRIVDSYDIGATIENHEKIIHGIKYRDTAQVRKYLRKDLSESRKQLLKYFSRLRLE